MAQKKIIGSVASKQNVPYFNQQSPSPDAAEGNIKEHPLAVQNQPAGAATDYASEQGQQLQDKAGA